MILYYIRICCIVLKSVISILLFHIILYKIIVYAIVLYCNILWYIMVDVYYYMVDVNFTVIVN